MKRLHSFKLVALLSVVAGSLNAYGDCEGPLERGRWYVMPKIGVAPGIFANRGYEHVVAPANAILADCMTQDTTTTCRTLATTPSNVFERNLCKSPKFNDIWSNGVLHVGGEIGYNTCDNGQMFVDLFYNRASGDCVRTEGKYFKAPAGCDDDCNYCPTGDALTTLTRDDHYEDYSAFGAYLGHRHYFNRVWCDRISFFTGVKFGIQHRKDVCVCTTIPAQSIAYTSGTPSQTITYDFAERTGLTATAICKSNAVSGGLQLGLDYCWNDCWSFLIGVEVQATCPFKVNRNRVLDLAIPNVSGTANAAGQYIVPQVTNIVGCGFGTFVQFPVWAALRWEFDMCNPCCDPCA